MADYKANRGLSNTAFLVRVERSTLASTGDARNLNIFVFTSRMPQARYTTLLQLNGMTSAVAVSGGLQLIHIKTL